MAVTISCTKIEGTTITAQATADATVVWGLYVTPNGGGMGQLLPPTSMRHDGTKYSATWSPVPAGSYTVTASEGGLRGDSQGVPFGTCS